MNNVIAWIAAEGERPGVGAGVEGSQRRRAREEESLLEQLRAKHLLPEQLRPEDLPAHQFPGEGAACPEVVQPEFVQPEVDQPEVDQQSWHARQAVEEDRERERRTYRGRTVAMLRRYMRYSIETGRLPSLLGREFFRAKVTAYTVVTFEDRVIFVHDMERCLDRLDDFSRQLIARHILQEHDRWATARLLHCNEKTVRRYTPVVLDVLSEVLLEVGLMERLEGGRELDGLEESRTRSGESMRRNSCQGGKRDAIDASDCGDEEYKV